MRRTSILILALAAALLGAAPPAGADKPSKAPAGYLEVIEPVASGVWVIRQSEPFHLQPIGNVTVIEQEDGLVLVDAGGSPGSGRRIAGLVRSVSDRPVKAVLITHWHGDHSLGLSAIRREWPDARLIATEATRRNLIGKPMGRYAKGAPDPERTAAFIKSLDEAEAFVRAAADKPGRTAEERAGFLRTLDELAIYRRDVEGLHVEAPTETFRDRLVIPDRGNPIEIFHPGPANTDGDAALWLPRRKLLVAGDLVVAPVPFGFGSHPASWQQALARLDSYDFDILIPGHGAPQTDRAYLRRLSALIGEVRAQVGPLARRGLPLEDVRKRIDLTEQRSLFAGSDPWLGRWFDAYWVQPFVEAAWKEAKGLPIEQGVG